MKIVIYARFSSHSQNEQSIEGQLKICYEYAQRNGYSVIGEYIDRAISGTAADNRPEFQRMIADRLSVNFKQRSSISLIASHETVTTVRHTRPS